MYTYLLQDWVTLSGTSLIASVKQSRDAWLGFTGFQDAVGWIQVSEATAAANLILSLETSPTEDEIFFPSLTASYLPMPKPMAQQALGTGVFALIIPGKTAPQPLSKWLRWVITVGTAGTWFCTFRILMSVNAVEANFQAVRGPSRSLVNPLQA